MDGRSSTFFCNHVLQEVEVQSASRCGAEQKSSHKALEDLRCMCRLNHVQAAVF